MSKALLMLLLTLLAAAQALDIDPDYDYDSYCEQFDRNYTGAEYDHHKAMFNQNYTEMLQLIAEGHDLQVTNFTDWNYSQLQGKIFS